jgi:imidazolonepropionase-like amidohydrolase
LRKALGSIGIVFCTALSLGAQPASKLSEEARKFVSVEGPVVALVGVQVVDGTGSPPKPAQTLLIENGRITALGSASDVAIPAGAQRLELSGHTVIPGIVGMHNHTFYTTSQRASQMNVTSPRLYLASGVTTIRTTGSFSPYAEINLKRSIESGEIAGPRMHVTGPYISGRGASTEMAQVTTPEDARRVVSYWAEEGATWFKAYTLISRAELEAAIDEAHKRGLKFTAHLCSVTFREAVDLGIDGLEHGFFTNTEYDPDKKPDECPPDFQKSLQKMDIRGEQVQATVRHMIENKVALTSTLAVYELYVPGRPPLEDRVLQAIAPEAREEYLEQRKEIAAAAKDSVMADIFPRAQAFEHLFYKSGGLLAAGVDPTGSGGALPGFGDQRNYELLLEAEFTPAEALQIMTLNGAKVLGVDKDLGSIAPGKIADLVLIEGDPVARRAEIRNVVTVFKDGVGYDSKKLIDSVEGLVGIQ